MTRPDWLPESYQGGLQDLINEVKPSLTRHGFESDLKGYLDNYTENPGVSNFVKHMSSESKLIDRLFKRCFYFLKQKDAVKQLRTVVNGSKFKKRLGALKTFNKKRPLTKQLNAFALCLDNLKVPKYGSSPARIQEIQQRLQSLKGSIQRFETETKFHQRLMEHDKIELASWAKPEPLTQLMFDLDLRLRNAIPKASDETIELIIAGCAVAAKVAPSTVDRVVHGRLYNANKSYFKDAEKWSDFE